MSVTDIFRQHEKAAEIELGRAMHVHVNITMHFTVWCSGGDFDSQVSKNVTVFEEMFRELRHWPGAGINIHFEVYDFEVFEKHAPVVLELIAECVENGAVELMKGGLVDYGALITPLEDLEKNHRIWDEYVRKRFGVDTDGLFVFPNEMQYHPNMPRVWNRCGIAGIIVNPYNSFLREHNFEPLELIGEGGCSSLVISSINEDTKIMNYVKGVFKGITLDESTIDQVYKDILTKPTEYARENRITDPIIAYAHDLTSFEPKSLSRLLGLIQDVSQMSSISLARYAKLVKPRLKVRLDQGSWDTFYEWRRCSEGWFTQQPWHLHINGLSYYAHQKLHEIEGLKGLLGSDLGMREEIQKAEEEMLLSERTTSRAHWSHPSPRRWVQEYALNSIGRSQSIVKKMGEAVLAKMPSADDASLLNFTLVNTSERAWEGMYYSELSMKDGGQLPDSIQVSDPEGRPLPCQLLESGTLVFPAALAGNAARAYLLRVSKSKPCDGGSALRVTSLEHVKVVLENDLVELVLDVSNGGCIDRYEDKENGRTILSNGNVFAGKVLLGRDADGRDCRDALITDDGKPASWETIAEGPLVGGVRVTSELVPGLASRFTEYYLEKGSRSLRVRTGTDFSSPVWFVPEYDDCARITFEPLLEEAQTVQWRMPGGALRPQEVSEDWSGFDTLGWVHLYDGKNGLGIAVKLYPNGPRMVCMKKGAVALAVSGTQRLEPYYVSAASLGSQSYEFVIVPTDGQSELLEDKHNAINKAPLVLCDERKHPAAVLRRPAEDPVAYGDSHFSEACRK